jgi:hypothetical protein
LFSCKVRKYVYNGSGGGRNHSEGKKVKKMQTEFWPRNTPTSQKKGKHHYIKVWSADDDSLLCKKYYDEGMKIESIVPLLNRSYTSVKARLDLIGEKYLNERIKQMPIPKEETVTLPIDQFNIICESFEYIIKSLNSLHAKIDQLP